MEKVTLSNGVKMPLIGYGSLRTEDGAGEKCVREAIEVGRAVKNSGVARDELFITTKVWLTNTGDKTLPSIRKERMAENINILDFALADDEMKRIEALDTGENIIMNHRDPIAMEAFFANPNANTWKNV